MFTFKEKEFLQELLHTHETLMRRGDKAAIAVFACFIYNWAAQRNVPLN
jgi:hypothetical protein